MGKPTSLLRRSIITILFLLAVPGLVVVVIPGSLVGWSLRPPFFQWNGSRWPGVALILLGALPLMESFIRFVTRGLGTPAPVFPPQRLVVTGFYRFVRNPMYLGVVTILTGEAFLLGSTAIVIYALMVAFGFHIFVIAYEEPTLRQVYGEEYESYRRRVRRWLPRLPQR